MTLYVSIGRKLVLWRIAEIRKSVWIDSLRNLRPVYVVSEQIPVLVTGVNILVPERPILTLVTEGKRPTLENPKSLQIEELTAISADGTVYTCVQKKYQPGDLASAPFWTDEAGDEFAEACQAYNNRFCPFVDKNCEKITPLGATICKMHDYAYMPDNPAGCLYG